MNAMASVFVLDHLSGRKSRKAGEFAFVFSVSRRLHGDAFWCFGLL